MCGKILGGCLLMALYIVTFLAVSLAGAVPGILTLCPAVILLIASLIATVAFFKGAFNRIQVRTPGWLDRLGAVIRDDLRPRPRS